MATDNIFSGLKVVDLASFIAGPGAATILSDFGAEVIKVEPPTEILENRAQDAAATAFQRHLPLASRQSQQAWNGARSEVAAARRRFSSG